MGFESIGILVSYGCIIKPLDWRTTKTKTRVFSDKLMAVQLFFFYHRFHTEYCGTETRPLWLYASYQQQKWHDL